MGIAVILTLAAVAGDHSFARVQEEWVVAAVPSNRLEAYLPDRQARLVRMLGCEHVACREEAAEQLRLLGPAAERALILGEMHRDPQVRDLAGKLLDERFRCGNCHGTGTCPTWFAPDPGSEVEFKVCGCGTWCETRTRHACGLCSSTGEGRR